MNGDAYWQDVLSELIESSNINNATITKKDIRDCEFFIKNDRLVVLDKNGACFPDKILWRVGAIKPNCWKDRAIMDMIELSGVQCYNDVKALMKGYDRLSMLNVMRELGFPINPFNVSTSTSQLENVKMDFPFVIKAGNFHGGFGKDLIKDDEDWERAKSMLFITDCYVTIEEYIEYDRDIRYLAIGDEIWAMTRWGRYWKANVQTTDYKLIDSGMLDPKIVDDIRRLQRRLDLDIVAIDILEKDGKYIYMEYNDIPELSGFPEECVQKLAKIVLALV